MISYRTDKKVHYTKLIFLFEKAEWNDKASDISRLKLMIRNSQIVVTAWDEEDVIGFSRCTTDYIFNGQINNVSLIQDI